MVAKKVNKFFGDILVHNGLLDKERLQYALRLKRTSESCVLTGQILVNSGFIKEEDVVLGLVVQYGFPFLPLNEYEIDKSFANILSQEFLRKHTIVPVEKSGNSLSIAMANPLDREVVKEISDLTNCHITVFLSTQSAIRNKIDLLYKKTEAPVVPETVGPNRVQEFARRDTARKQSGLQPLVSDQDCDALIAEVKELYAAGQFFAAMAVCWVAADEFVRVIFLKSVLGKNYTAACARQEHKTVHEISAILLLKFLKEYGLVGDYVCACLEHLQSLRERYTVNAQQASAADTRVGIHYLEHLFQQRNAVTARSAGSV